MLIRFYYSSRRMSYYAVRVGRQKGIYASWSECEAQVKGFPKAAYKKFKTESEAIQFIGNGTASTSFGTKTLKRKIMDDVSICGMKFPNTEGSLIINSSCNTQYIPRIEIPSSNGPKGSFYAVHRGKKRGVYKTWTECEEQIKGYKNPLYRKLPSEEEARQFVNTGGIQKLTRREAKTIEMNCDFADEGEEIEYVLEDVKVDSKDFVTVFTDGASSRNGKVGAAAGIGIYWGPNHPLNTSMRLTGRQTNNRAEIFAATHALRQAKIIGAENVKLYTDSQFLIHGITDWINKWQRNNWKLANGHPVINKEDFIELNKAREGLNVEFIYIKAHDNNPGNVEADALAVAGARKELEDTFIQLV